MFFRNLAHFFAVLPLVFLSGGSLFAQSRPAESVVLASFINKSKTGDKDKAAAAYKSPEYADPSKYTEQPIQIVSGSYTLPGIVTWPKGKTDVPLIVLVHDAGAHDKDMTIGANKPFRDIALGLADQGIATLRYDNRTKVYGAGIAKKIEGFTVEDEVITDAVAAVKTGSKLPGVNSKKLFVLGYGFGGLLAPRIAEASPELNGIILLATPARSATDYFLDKAEYEFSLHEKHSRQELDAINTLRLQVGNVRGFSLSAATPADSLPFGLPASYWLDLREYNQGYAARNVPQRILILHPERGFTVGQQDIQKWQKGLQHRGKQYTPLVYSDLNHLLQEGKGDSTPEELLQPKNVPMYVMRNIMTWVRFGL